MRLICPKCASEYEVDGTLFGGEGREVQCSSCEEVWTQYPTVEEPPLRLDDGAAAIRPSERLPEEERAALGQAVQDELAAQSGESEEDILAALRAQIAEEGGDFEKGDAAMSQRRNLAKAAESAGVEIGSATETEGTSRRWGVNLDEDDTPATGLSAALKELEKAPPSRRAPGQRRSGMRAGFVTAVVLVGLGVGAYLLQDRIIEGYPPAEPVVAQVNGYVDQGRTKVEELYAEYQPIVMGMIADLTSGSEEAAAE